MAKYYNKLYLYFKKFLYRVSNYLSLKQANYAKIKDKIC